MLNNEYRRREFVLSTLLQFSESFFFCGFNRSKIRLRVVVGSAVDFRISTALITSTTFSFDSTSSSGITSSTL